MQLNFLGSVSEDADIHEEVLRTINSSASNQEIALRIVGIGKTYSKCALSCLAIVHVSFELGCRYGVITCDLSKEVTRFLPVFGNTGFVGAFPPKETFMRCAV